VSKAHNTNRRRSSQMQGERECKLRLIAFEVHKGIGYESWSGCWSSQEWMDRRNEMGGPRIWRRRGSSLAGAVAWDRWGGSLGRGAREGASERAREGERERGVSVWGEVLGFWILKFEKWALFGRGGWGEGEGFGIWIGFGFLLLCFGLSLGLGLAVLLLCIIIV